MGYALDRIISVTEKANDHRFLIKQNINNNKMVAFECRHIFTITILTNLKNLSNRPGNGNHTTNNVVPEAELPQENDFQSCYL